MDLAAWIKRPWLAIGVVGIGFTPRDQARWLSALDDLKPSTYRMKAENEKAMGERKAHLGLIAEGLPLELRGPNGDTVDLYALTTALVAATKELKAEIQDQARTIEELTLQLAATR